LCAGRRLARRIPILVQRTISRRRRGLASSLPTHVWRICRDAARADRYRVGVRVYMGMAVQPHGHPRATTIEPQMKHSSISPRVLDEFFTLHRPLGVLTPTVGDRASARTRVLLWRDSG